MSLRLLEFRSSWQQGWWAAGTLVNLIQKHDFAFDMWLFGVIPNSRGCGQMLCDPLGRVSVVYQAIYWEEE
jgi:hypothetical protein